MVLSLDMAAMILERMDRYEAKSFFLSLLPLSFFGFVSSLYWLGRVETLKG